MNSPVITNNLLKKLTELGLGEEQVLETFNKGDLEKWKEFNVSVKKYSGYELRVFWKRNPDGKYLLVSVSKRERR